MAVRPKLLRRYTDLPALLAILHQQEVTLLPPTAWDDKNDRNVMAAYQRAKGLKSLLALCLSEGAETYHHWKVYAHGPSGVCIEFHRDTLLQALPTANLTHKSISYTRTADLELAARSLSLSPFLKPAAFAAEKEYRIVFASRTQTVTSKRIPVPVSTIKRVVLSPWLPAALLASTVAALRSVQNCSRLVVVQSSLIDSPTWRSLSAGYA